METIFRKMKNPSLYTVLSPALLHLYDVTNTVVVVIDVLRATSTIATALFNGAKEVIPVDSVEKCIQLGKKLACVTAGERDGQIAPGLQYGNSSFEYPREFIGGKTLVLTTTNGTKLLHMALAKGATEIITGSFLNLSAVCDHLASIRKKRHTWLCRLEGQAEYGRYLICRRRYFTGEGTFQYQLRRFAYCGKPV